MHGFSHQFPIAWENARKLIEWEKPRKLVPRKILQNPSCVENLGNWKYFSQSMGTFLPSDSHPVVYFTTWEMYGFSHRFLIARENVATFTL